MAGLALLESKMDRIELKSEAKRLRSAMREVVGVVTKPMPGHLMLFCGTTGAGMTCTASAMAASLAEPQPSDLLIVADFPE